MGRPFSLKTAFCHGKIWTHLIHDSLGQFVPTTHTVFRSIQPFLQGSRLWQTDGRTDRQTDRPRYSVS